MKQLLVALVVGAGACVSALGFGAVAQATPTVVKDSGVLSQVGGDIVEGQCTLIRPCSSDSCGLGGVCIRCVGAANWLDCDNQPVEECNVSGTVDCGLQYTCTKDPTQSNCVCINCSAAGQCIKDSCTP